MKKTSVIIFLLFAFSLKLTAQQIISSKINWTAKDFEDLATLLEQGAKKSDLPCILHKLPIVPNGNISASWHSITYKAIDEQKLDRFFLNENIELLTETIIERKNSFGVISFFPIRKNPSSQKLEIIDEYQISFNVQPNIDLPRSKLVSSVFESEFNTGAIYQVSVNNTGIYKLDYNFLKNTLGITNIDNVSPKKIRILGQKGGMLPENNDVARIDDLAEIEYLFVGNDADGVFNSNDYILFYAVGPDKITYSNEEYEYVKNIYTYKNNYFIKIESQNRSELSSVNYNDTPEWSTRSFDYIAHHELEQRNLLEDWSNGTGSGKKWLGEYFKFENNQEFDFQIPNFITNEVVSIKTTVAASSIGSGSTFSVSVNGTNSKTQFLSPISGVATGRYAHYATIQHDLLLNNGNIRVGVNFLKSNSEAEGWLDYITVLAKSELKLNGGYLLFRDAASADHEFAEFIVENTNSNTQIWDVQDPTQPKSIQGNRNNSTTTFTYLTNQQLVEFVAFDVNNSYATPNFEKVINNQNLHGISEADLVVVYHREFQTAVNKFVAHRQNYSNYNVKAIEIEQIYLEFASGNPDPTAIRDFAKMLHERSDNFKYLLLFGDGSFDYKNTYQLSSGIDNFIPVFETSESFDPIYAYPSDDYYGLLSAGEGANLSGGLDVAVGRFPVRTTTEAEEVVRKIMDYETNSLNLGSWKNDLLFCADDEDNDLHIRDANAVADNIFSNYKQYNLDKIFWDYFQQLSLPEGERYPDATNSISNRIYKGSFIVNYMGHGGSSGWSQEHVLTIPIINSWSNFRKLPLFVTATCSFAAYDDANFTTPGELLFLKANGGAIALMTTTRAVFASANKRLATEVFDRIFEEDAILGYPTLGDVIQASKNAVPTDIVNNRKFALLGDPSMKLAYPKHRVYTSKINGSPIGSQLDTIRALEEVSIEGFVGGSAGQVLSNFNGIINVTVFDKAITVNTRGNDPTSSEFPFLAQKNVLHKGRASVNNGLFKISFVVPKDINYAFGEGKISYYADNTEIDAAGYFDKLIIGGSPQNGLNDDVPPIVDVFMNTEDFVSGGITDENPILLVLLSDDLGINVTGNSVGHDLAAVLDNNTQEIIVLNDFYESELDDYKKGTVRYPLYKIPEGLHEIEVTAWDISNNSNKGSTRFIVAESGELALKHVLNYPNPFTTHTEFMFEHNLAFAQLDVRVEIFTISGKLVKTISQQISAEGYRTRGISWDGLDDFGDRLGRGVYLYRISLRATNIDGQEQTAESKFEKIVLLR